MSENSQSKINTWLLGLLLTAMTGFGGGGLLFWRDISVSVSKLEQAQVATFAKIDEVKTAYSTDIVELRQRMNALEQRARDTEIDLLKLKAGIK